MLPTVLDADRAQVAPRSLVEPGFLVALRGEHQVIETILLAVLLEQLDRLLKAPPIVEHFELVLVLQRIGELLIRWGAA
jgi:hypothetical protein